MDNIREPIDVCGDEFWSWREKELAEQRGSMDDVTDKEYMEEMGKPYADKSLTSLERQFSAASDLPLVEEIDDPREFLLKLAEGPAHRHHIDDPINSLHKKYDPQEEENIMRRQKYKRKQDRHTRGHFPHGDRFLIEFTEERLRKARDLHRDTQIEEALQDFHGEVPKDQQATTVREELGSDDRIQESNFRKYNELMQRYKERYEHPLTTEEIEEMIEWGIADEDEMPDYRDQSQVTAIKRPEHRVCMTKHKRIGKTATHNPKVDRKGVLLVA